MAYSTSELILTATQGEAWYQPHLSDGETESQRRAGTFPMPTHRQSSRSIPIWTSWCFAPTVQILFDNIQCFHCQEQLKLWLGCFLPPEWREQLWPSVGHFQLKTTFLVNITVRICMGNGAIKRTPDSPAVGAFDRAASSKLCSVLKPQFTQVQISGLEGRGNIQGKIYNTCVVGSNGIWLWILQSHWNHGSEPPWLSSSKGNSNVPTSQLTSQRGWRAEETAECAGPTSGIPGIGCRHSPAPLPTMPSAHQRQSLPPPSSSPSSLPSYSVRLFCYIVNSCYLQPLRFMKMLQTLNLCSSWK